jgi:starch-binding outer membrane protein, SusD/RagB family
MKTNMRRALAVTTTLLLGGVAACTDVTTTPRDTVNAENVFNDPGAYRQFLAKIYGGLQVTGQQGPAGAGDIRGIDEGFSHYLRQYWQLEQLPTDETVIGWGDPGLPEFNTQQWGPANGFLTAMYYRIFFQVGLVNEFLRQTTDEKLTSRNVTPALRAEIEQYRAEARYLRALSYWHGIDLFGNIPLVDENFVIGADAPPQATRAQVYDFVVGELNAIRPTLPAPNAGQHGRADQGAVLMLLAKLYLNSAVYTGTPRYAEARQAAEAVIAGGYTLDDDYDHVFLADNHTSPEIIFAIPFDGANTRTWGGMTFLTHAAVGGNMNAGSYGLDGGWWGLRTRPQVYNLYGAGDTRASFFFTSGQSVQINAISDFFQGVAAPKYRNVTSTGQPGSNSTFPDTDFPMFRLADAYLMYAEAHLRGGGGSATTALNYVNALRTRAYGDASGNITAPQLTLDFILAERARELFWEAHRRTDLVRFGRFTGGSYIWTFKGGTAAGQATPAHLDLYPIPATELVANPNLSQNPGYN